MTGFIRGLFGSKGKADNESGKPVNPAAASEKASKEFFLDPDDAKTFGDIDYMRSVKVVRRTFPKTKGNGGEFEVVQQVSAMGAEALKQQINMGAATVEAQPNVAPKPVLENNGGAPLPSTVVERRADSSMDLFRNMAKDIKKR